MKHPFTVVLIILAVWIAAQSIGLLVVEHYGVTDLPAGVERPDTDAQGVLWYLLIGIAIGTGLLLLLARFNQERLWAVWFSLAVFMLSYIALSAFLPLTAALLVSGVFVWLKVDTRLHWIPRNIPELFLYAGIAGVFVPMLTLPIALLLLLAISIYDAIAVWRSKHMVSLARFQIESGRFAGFSIPRAITTPKAAKSDAKKGAKKAKPVQHGGSAILGGGDFAFPLLFSGTLLLTLGWVPAIGSVIGGYIALLLLFTYSQKNKFYPAMPFLAAGLILGGLLGTL